MGKLQGKTAFVTGASRGIGKAIALSLAREGVNITVAAKTTEPHPKLKGTIYTAADEISEAGARALAVKVDVRKDDEVKAAIEKTVQTFGGIDILVNNASAIMLANTEFLPMKRFDLMHQVNVRGTYLCSKLALPYLKKSTHGHILMLSPPLNMNPMWFGNHLGYTLSKYGMSMCVIGLAEELSDENIAVNGLWPATTIATAAIQNLLGGASVIQASRKPTFMGEAALHILKQDPGEYTGQLLLDEDVMREAGIEDFSAYSVNPDTTLQRDLFLDP